MHFRKADIVPELNEEEARNYHNFLQRMVKLGVLLREGEQGEYRFATYLHHIYLNMLARRAIVKSPSMNTGHGA